MRDSFALGGLACTSLSAALACVWSPTAVAQQGGLEEVVVTARYREENLQETPIAITAVTAQDIQTRAFASSFEVGYMIPNASLRPAQAAFGNTMTAFIRGIGQNDFDFAFEPGVGIYIDDVYHPFTLGSQIELLDLERVEVLRGPQGTLFGRGAIGGAIRYVTQQPQGDETGSIRLTVGDFNRVDVRASYDFSVTENVFVRVAGMSRDREGYQDMIDFACAFPELAGSLTPQTVNRGAGCKVGTLGGEDVVGARGSLRWVRSDAFEVTVTADYQNDSSEARADTLVLVDPNLWPSFVPGVPYDERFLPPSPYVTYATFSDPLSDLRVTPESGLEKSMLSARADWALSDRVSLAAILAYTDLTATLATDADGSPLNMQTVDGIQETDYLTAELRFSGRAWDRMDWTAGAFLYDGDSINQQMVSIPFFSLILDGIPPDQNASRPFVNARNVHENRNESIYGHIVYDVTDRLAVNAGVRFSDDRKDVNFDNTRVQNPNVVVADDHFDWRIGVDYRWTEALMGYASVATGYRPGSYNPRPFQATQVVAVENEESTAYEIGVKADLLDRQLRVNAALFFTDWETRILGVQGEECPLIELGPPPVYATVPPGTPGAETDTLGNVCLPPLVSRTFYENGPGEIRGVEVEVAYRPADRWTIGAVYGLTDWESADINDNPNVLIDRPVYVPEDNWSVSVAYSASTANGGTWTPRLDLYGQSEICTSNVTVTSTFPGAGCSDGYELLNARLEWASPDREWLVALGATNVRDEEYFLNKFDLTAFGQPHVEGQPGSPRQWYLTLQRDF